MRLSSIKSHEDKCARASANRNTELVQSQKEGWNTNEPLVQNFLPFQATNATLRVSNMSPSNAAQTHFQSSVPSPPVFPPDQLAIMNELASGMSPIDCLTNAPMYIDATLDITYPEAPIYGAMAFDEMSFGGAEAPMYTDVPADTQNVAHKEAPIYNLWSGN
ncbi:unnamed protein product [Fusarium langsethiae]|nr:unnamed protein product [Fusarium langsethiae]